MIYAAIATYLHGRAKQACRFILYLSADVIYRFTARREHHA
jgi:hypothetical protein